MFCFKDPLRLSKCVQVSVGPHAWPNEPREQQLWAADGDQLRLQQPHWPRQEEVCAKDHPCNSSRKNQGNYKVF